MAKTYDITKKNPRPPRNVREWYTVFRAGFRNPAALALRIARKEVRP